MIEKWLQVLGEAVGWKLPKTFSLSPIQNGRKVTVLLIDDDPDFLSALQGSLQAEGFTVLTASSGDKGLNILCSRPNPVDILLLDFEMPKFDGANTLQHVRKLNPQIKVVGLTAITSDRLPGEYRNGVDKLISKPFKISDLIASIAELARLQEASAGKKKRIRSIWNWEKLTRQKQMMEHGSKNHGGSDEHQNEQWKQECPHCGRRFKPSDLNEHIGLCLDQKHLAKR